MIWLLFKSSGRAKFDPGQSRVKVWSKWPAPWSKSGQSLTTPGQSRVKLWSKWWSGCDQSVSGIWFGGDREANKMLNFSQQFTSSKGEGCCRIIYMFVSSAIMYDSVLSAHVWYDDISLVVPHCSTFRSTFPCSDVPLCPSSGFLFIILLYFVVHHHIWYIVA
jgi:hypothetical protein